MWARFVPGTVGQLRALRGHEHHIVDIFLDPWYNHVSTPWNRDDLLLSRISCLYKINLENSFRLLMRRMAASSNYGTSRGLFKMIFRIWDESKRIRRGTRRNIMMTSKACNCFMFPPIVSGNSFYGRVIRGTTAVISTIKLATHSPQVYRQMS